MGESAVNKNGPHLSGQEALKIVRAAFPYLPAEGEPRIDLEEDTYRGQTVWRIDAEGRPSYRPGPPPGCYATVDAATGEILEMHWRPAPRAGAQEIKGVISREKARAVAEDLARRLQPEKFAWMTANPSPSAYPGYRWPVLGAAYHFSWSRTHDGIPVRDDGLHIAVDALTSLVTGYTLLWREDIKLPPAGAVLPAGEIPAKVAAKAGMVLVYEVFPGGAAPAQVRPVY
ncbi:MAG: PepSY domain-containing protein, partial [Desulfotomaculales bacterium]